MYFYGYSRIVCNFKKKRGHLDLKRIEKVVIKYILFLGFTSQNISLNVFRVKTHVLLE